MTETVPAARDRTRDQLRESVTLKSGHALRNRIIGLPAAGRAHVTSAGWPTDGMNRMYADRAAGGFSLVYVHATIVDPACTTPAELILADPMAVSAFSDLADAIKSNGALAGIQIISHWQNDFPYAMSELSVDDIEDLIHRHVRGAELAAEAGFDVVNLQASHGWPVQRFLSGLTNDRTDRYGAPDYVATRIMTEVRRAIGTQCAISWRLSVNEFAGPRGITPQLIQETMIPALAAAGCDLFDLSLGRSAVLPRVRDHLANETTYSDYGLALANFAGFRGLSDVPVSVRGRITSLEGAAEALTYGDLVGVARQAMADPDFANKVLGYDDQPICECIGCNYCLDRVVRLELPVRCAVNWTFNRTVVEPPAPSPDDAAKRVLIVGGGATGLTAAVALARYGADVSVYEASGFLGGEVRVAAELEHLNLGMLNTVVDRLVTGAEQVGVELKTSTVADVSAEAASGRWDAIVVATGARPSDAPVDLPADLEPMTSTDLLARPSGSVVLVGAGGEGAELAVELALRGSTVTLLDSSDSATSTSYDYDARRAEALDELIESSGVQRHDAVRVQRIDRASDGTVTVGFVTAQGTPGVVSASAFGLFGREADVDRPGARDSLVYDSVSGIPVLFAGDCARPMGLAEAIDAGERAARTLAARTLAARTLAARTASSSGAR